MLGRGASTDVIEASANSVRGRAQPAGGAELARGGARHASPLLGRGVGAGRPQAAGACGQIDILRW